MSSDKPKHHPWSKITEYHSVSKELDSPILFRPKIKLHGTNAGISVTTVNNVIEVVPQGRNQFMDHKTFGGQFYALVMKNKPTLISIREKLGRDYVIYGELCGEKIQPVVACSKLPCHHFFVFSLKLINDNDLSEYIFEPDDITKLLSELSDPQIKILPWEHEPIELWKENNINLKLINEMTMAADECDPYIKREFGIIGPGEGYVWYSLTGELKFKSKGDTHRNIKTKKPAVEQLPTIESLSEYLDLYMTSQRYEQGLKESGCDGTMKTIREFVLWVSKDVSNESDERKFNFGSSFIKDVNARASLWYKNYVNKS